MAPSDERETVSRSTITVTCRLFGRYAEALGLATAELELPAHATAGDAVVALRSRLERPDLLPHRPLVAINQHHALPDSPLADGDEVALLPPLAGG
jgi:molybdopterin synthase catalytic subunit